MYGTTALVCDSISAKRSFSVYKTYDLETFEEGKIIFDADKTDFWADRDFWAPEVHYYNGRFYMFATFLRDNGIRGTGILVSDTPDGKFVPNSNDNLTPDDWFSLDGTLWVEDGRPYMVFCHEWIQIGAGTVCAVELSADLKKTVGEPFLLWSSENAVWKHDLKGNGSYVTDGPFLIRRGDELISIWSSFCTGKKYCEAIARSDNGSIYGKWTIDEKLMLENDGGHGMIFKDNDGNDYFVYHSPNTRFDERPCIKKINLDELFENNR
jgi:GH43 family beta-xylosidase